MKKRLPQVALLIGFSRNYRRGILHGIANYTRASGPWSCFTPEQSLYGGIPDWLKTWKGDGIIACIDTPRAAKELLRMNCPVVDVLHNARFAEIPCFDTDAGIVAQLAAEYFLKSGFRHFAFCGFPGIPFSDRREAAFVEFLSDRQFEVPVFSVRPKKNLPLDIPAAERQGIGRAAAIVAWLRRLPRPLALLACNDICGQQVLNACRSHGIKVPEEVAVMGVDNDEVLCNLCDPPLSSVEPDTERLGYEAAALLDRMMRGKRVRHGLVKVPPHRVVERASSDTVPIEDPVTAKALRFIRDHVGEGIAVKDVQAHVRRSRTDLENRFRRHLNISVSTEIWRRRMDRVCSLLQETDLRLGEIARQSGFATDSHLCRSFKARFQMTPAEHRLSCKNRQRDW
jgi:LacI family transcriptional regulator